MHKLTVWILRLFVFSLGFEFLVTLELIGSITRLLGLAALATGVLTVAMHGRARRPGAVLNVAIAFTLCTALSIVWTINHDATISRIITYSQLLGFVWLLWQFARTVDDQESLMIAYCLSAYAPVADLMSNFSAGVEVANTISRYAADSFDPNDLGLMLGIGIPMAWHLFAKGGTFRRLLGATYFPVATLAILLTGSRGAFLASIVAFSIIPLTIGRSIRSMVVICGVVITVAATSVLIVPDATWERLLSSGEEVSSGSMSGRREIWTTALHVFPERPVLGVGAGAFATAVQPILGPRNFPHNVFLAILLEHGVVGFVVFGALLGTCVWSVYRLPSEGRRLWSVIGLTWMVGAMSLGWEYRKITWFIFGLVAAQAAAARSGCVAVAPDRAERLGCRGVLPQPALIPERIATRPSATASRYAPGHSQTTS